MFENEKEEESNFYVCLGPRCRKNNSDKFAEALEKVLKTKIDQPTETDLIKLLSSGCMGQCSYGPNIKAGGKIYTKVDKEVLKRVIIIMKNKLSKET